MKMTVEDEIYQELADRFESIIDSEVEYACEHDDAGSAYSHLPREGGWFYHCGPMRLRCFLNDHEIELNDEGFDQLVDELLDDCEIIPGHIFSSQRENEFLIDSYPVGEVESQFCLGDLASMLDITREEAGDFVALAMDDNRFYLKENTCCGDPDGVLSYTNTDSVWLCQVDVEWIKQRVEWIKEGQAV